ncbi:MAG: hypothetical protein IPM17_05650 [Verrucomicrobia bacterium]|nr:hypothetical protein [Verrucomicrobiota bacterium]
MNASNLFECSGKTAPLPVGRVATATWLVVLGCLALAPFGAAQVPAATPPPARVQLATFEALDAGGRALVRWETSLEWGVLLYHLYRQTDGQWQRVNADAVIAESQLSGGRYQVVDSGAAPGGPVLYRLEAINLSGQPQEIAVRSLAIAGRASEAELAAPASRPRVTPQREPEVTRPARQIALASPPPPINLPAGPERVKIRTTAQGMHFLSTATLATLLNQPVATVQGWIDAGTITLSNLGQPVNYVPGQGFATTSTLQPGLYFYAESLSYPHSSFTRTNIYWLQAGANALHNQSVDGGNPAHVSPGPYTELLKQEANDKQAISVVQDPDDDLYIWTFLIADSVADTLTSTFNVSRLVRTAGTQATLGVRLYGASVTPHKVEVRLNGNLLGEPTFAGLGPQWVEFTFDAETPAALKDSAAGQGANTLTLTAVLPPGGTSSRVGVDKYQLTYHRTYYASTSTRSIEAGAEGHTTITVADLNSANQTAPQTFLAFDISNPRQIRAITNLRIERTTIPGTSTMSWLASFNPPSANARFAVIRPLTDSSARVVAANALSVESPANLGAPTNQGSYVVLAHSSLMAEAAQIAAHRSSSFRVKIVRVDDVFNEFAHGLATPHAIRSFAQTAHDNWIIPLRYLLLLGEGTFDYRDLTTVGDNLIPPLMVNTLFGLAASDSRFGDVLGDGEVRVRVGRLPVKTPAQFQAVYAKILAYEAQVSTSPRKALLVADQPDPAGDFIAGIQEVQHYLSPTYSSQLVHPPYAPDPIDALALRTQIQTALNAGVDILNYIGHGADDHFGANSNDYYMKVDQPLTLTPSLNLGMRLPIVVTMTCVAANFANPGWTSLVEGLVRQPQAGAAGAIGPTGLSLDDEAAYINRFVMEQFACTTTGRLGDLFAQSASLYATGVPRLTPVWIYNVLGDPAMPVVNP